MQFRESRFENEWKLKSQQKSELKWNLEFSSVGCNHERISTYIKVRSSRVQVSGKDEATNGDDHYGNESSQNIHHQASNCLIIQ